MISDETRKEIVAALEGDSNDAEHDALVSVAQELGLDWTPFEEQDERVTLTITADASLLGFELARVADLFAQGYTSGHDPDWTAS